MNERVNSKLQISLVLLIFLFALGVRVLLGRSLLTNEYQFSMGDDDDYHRLALSLLYTGELVERNYYAYRMPVYPLFIALVYTLAGPEPRVVIIVQMIISSVTCAWAFWLSYKWFRLPVGIFAGLLCAIDLAFVFYSYVLMTETLTVFLVLAGMVSIEALTENPTWRRASVAGLLLALITMIRVNYAFFVPVSIGWLLYVHKNRLKKVLAFAVIIAGIVGLIWAMWVIRNFMVLGTFIPLTTQAGRGYYGVYNDQSLDCKTFQACGLWREMPLPEYTEDWNEVELDQWQRSQAWHWMLAHPAQSIMIALSQIAVFWRPSYTFLELVLYGGGLLGVIFTRRQRILGVQLWILLAVTLTITSTITLAVERFRLPLQPWIYIMFAYACTTGVRHIRHRRVS